MALFEEIVLLFALIIGILVGEILASRVFGRPKRFVLVLVELFIFIIFLVVLSRSIFLTQEDFGISLIINAVLGFISIIIASAITTGVGYLGSPGTIRRFQQYNVEEKLIINTAKTLAKNGIEEKDIEKTLVESGFKKKKVEEILRSHHFKTKAHPYLEKIAKLEKEIKKLKKRS